MIHLKDRTFLKLQLSASVFSVLILQVFLLTKSCEGQLQPIVAMVGDDIILPFNLQPAKDASDVTVVWTRPDLNPSHVHVRRDNKDFLISQNPQYMGRTSVNKTRVKCGDVSLKLYKVKVSDAGTYRCVVPNLDIDFTVQLVVGAVSLSPIDVAVDTNGVVCKSKGWYPEPEVLWLDSEGNLLSAGPTETVRGPDDLYTVSSTVTVEKRHSNNITCRVQQRNLNQIRETHIHVPDDFFMAPPSCSVEIIISLIVCFVCVLIIGLVVWKIKKTKKQQRTVNNNKEHQRLFERTTAKLEDELENNDGEMKHVEQIFKTLGELKKQLDNQTDTLNTLQQQLKIQKEEKMKRLKQVENQIVRNEDPDWRRQQKHRDIPQLRQDIKHIEHTMTAHEDMLNNTHKLLEKIEGMITKIAEKKGKLKSEKEQINKQLQEQKNKNYSRGNVS